jgi:hypothetical protein
LRKATADLRKIWQRIWVCREHRQIVQYHLLLDIVDSFGLMEGIVPQLNMCAANAY